MRARGRPSARHPAGLLQPLPAARPPLPALHRTQPRSAQSRAPSPWWLRQDLPIGEGFTCATCGNAAIAISPRGGYVLNMAHDHLHESHPSIVKRLKRAEGHLRRVIEMFDEGRSCLDLAQQLHAVEKALGEAKRALIHDHVDHCLNTAANEPVKSTVAVVDEFKAISKYL